MSRRPARIASAVFVNILAGLPLVTLAHAETVTVENCLSSPKTETPAGSHWYYRIDHVNKRNCWYLRNEGGGVAQETNAPAPAPAGKPSIADAHAELRPQPAVRVDTPIVNPPNITAGPVGSAAANLANTSIWNAAPLATRWPEVPPSISAPKTVVAASADNATQPEVVAPTAPPPTASITNLLLSVQPGIIPTLIAATIGALACAGVAALMSRRYRRRVRRRKATSARGPIWETTDDDRIVLSDYSAMDDRDYRPRFARGVASAAHRPRTPEHAQRAPRRARR